MKHLLVALCCITLAVSCARQQGAANDTNSPLHLMKPEYRNPYLVPTQEQVKESLDKVLAYLEKETPMQVIDKRYGNPVEFDKVDKNSALQTGAFRLTSYEWGVTYAGMLRVGEVTGDKKYTDYTVNRLDFLQQTAPYFRQLMEKKEATEPQLRKLIKPHALDDAGAMCAAFIKTDLNSGAQKYDGIVSNYMRWIMEGQYRLADGTLARLRPHRNTLWLDDMFMSIPAIAFMGKYSGEKKYYDEAVKQIRLFSSRMFVPEKKLFMHGWVEGMSEHPAFFWARANGWAVMTLVETLEALPENHAAYSEVLSLLKKHVKGLTALQSGEGLWHQLLDRNDSYLETSASAIYAYAFARAINKGWIDAKAYGPAVILAWNAVTKQINEQGQVMGTCVGTGMAFDPAYYYYRPISEYAAHGYGPVLLAGAEIIAMLKKMYPTMNDSAVQIYMQKQIATKPIFDENENNTYD